MTKWRGTMMDVFTKIALASDAEQMALVGVALWVLAGVFLVMERIRNARRSVEQLEKVGWVPWTPLFVGAAIMGAGCLAFSLPVVLGNL